MSDYSNFQPVNPMANFQQGYGLGQVIQQNVQAKAMAEAEKKRAMNQQQAIDKAMSPGGKPSDWLAAFQFTKPEDTEKMQAAYDTFSTEQKQRVLADASQLLSAGTLGDTELMKSLLQSRADAARNEDRDDQAKILEKQAAMLDSPEGLNIVMGSLIQGISGIEGSKELVDNLDTMTDTQGKQEDMKLKILEKGTALNKTSQELGDLYTAANNNPRIGAIITEVLDFASPTDGKETTFDADFRFNKFTELRKEFFSNKEILIKSNTSNNSVQSAYKTAKDNDGEGTGWIDAKGVPVPEGTEGAIQTSGIADLTLINLFQRQIDDATVRESDITNILSTIGGKGRILQWIDNLMKGTKLNDQQRRQIADMSKLLNEEQKKTFEREYYQPIDAAAKLLNANDQERIAIMGDYEPTTAAVVTAEADPAKPAATGVFTQVGDYRVANPASIDVVEFLYGKYPGLFNEKDKKLIESGAGPDEILANWDSKYGKEYYSRYANVPDGSIADDGTLILK